jgi:hypothetical protein
MIIQGQKLNITDVSLGFYINYKKYGIDYIPITKNSSSYMETFFDLALGEKSYENFIFDRPITPKKTLVILRDPIERWISGVVHYIYLQRRRPIMWLDEYDDIKKEYLYKNVDDNILFDKHTELQSNFLQNLDTDDLLFFKQEFSLQKRIKDFLRRNLKIQDSEWNSRKKEINFNRSYSNQFKRKLTDCLSQELINDKKLLDKVKKTYEYDIVLFKTANYYNSAI